MARQSTDTNTLIGWEITQKAKTRSWNKSKKKLYGSIYLFLVYCLLLPPFLFSSFSFSFLLFLFHSPPLLFAFTLHHLLEEVRTIAGVHHLETIRHSHSFSPFSTDLHFINQHLLTLTSHPSIRNQQQPESQRPRLRHKLADPCPTSPPTTSLPSSVNKAKNDEIGRASCRERVL